MIEKHNTIQVVEPKEQSIVMAKGRREKRQWETRLGMMITSS